MKVKNTFLNKLFSLILPDKNYNSVLSIDTEDLYNQGYRYFCFDIDNTLVERGFEFPEWKIKRFIKDLKQRGWKIILLSNNKNPYRVLKIADFLETDCIFSAYKPLSFIYEKIQMQGFILNQTVCVGDQLFMDILGGNLKDCLTIYINPIGPEFSLIRMMYISFEKNLLKILGLFLSRSF